MTFKLLKYNKYQETVQAFEARVRDFLSTIGDVIHMDMQEVHHSGDILLSFIYDNERHTEQRFFIDNMGVEVIEAIVNDAAIQSNSYVSQLNIVCMSKSPRNVVAFIVEKERMELADEEKRENENVDVKPKRRKKAKNLE